MAIQNMINGTIQLVGDGISKKVTLNMRDVLIINNSNGGYFSLLVKPDSLAIIQVSYPSVGFVITNASLNGWQLVVEFDNVVPIYDPNTGNGQVSVTVGFGYNG